MTTPVIPGQWRDFANRHLNVANVAGSEYLCLCPFHHDRNASFQFNVDSGLYVCFAGRCGAKGNIWTLAAHFGVVLDPRKRNDTEQLLDEALAVLRDAEARERRKGRRVEHIVPESTLLAYDIPTDYWTVDRGFDPETVAKFRLGFDVMADAVTIPMRNISGELLGVTKRFLDLDADIRYKYPRGFKRRLNLFGSWLMDEDEGDRVVLCEGAIDTMKVWQAGYTALGLYGSRISQTQVDIMRRAGVKTVVLYLDNDAAGRKAVRTMTGKDGSQIDLREHFVCYRADYTGFSRSTHGDPGSMDDDQNRKCVRRAKLLV